MDLFKQLVSSKTIWGIATAAAGAAVKFVETSFPEYGALISTLSGVLSASGLGLAVFGRVTAEGPIAPKG